MMGRAGWEKLEVVIIVFAKVRKLFGEGGLKQEVKDAENEKIIGHSISKFFYHNPHLYTFEYVPFKETSSS